MASFRPFGWEILETQIKILADTSTVGRACVLAAVRVVRPAIRSAYGGHRRTGRLLSSIKTTGPKQNALGYYAVVHTAGQHDKKTRNAAVAAYLEYGTPRHPAYRIVNGVMRGIEGQVLKAMQDTFDSMIPK